MKVRFKTCFRLWMALLLIAAGWSLVAGAQTASNKPALTNTPVPKAAVSRFDRLEPKNVTFGLDRVPALRDNRFLGEPLWKYAASILYVIAAFLLARLVDIVLFVWLRKLAARTRTEIDDLLLAVLHGPIKVLLFVLFLQIGLEVFNWSAKAHLYLSKTFVVVVAGALTYLTLRVSGLLLDVWKKRHYHEADRKFNDQLFSVIRRGLNI
ncbi:MAG TPA: hypothetical protein VHH88_10500, partial [Verrucomicrobiae bacterium]|nr:hypothetical protein [Verrucomicrobiae bacterium]